MSFDIFDFGYGTGPALFDDLVTAWQPGDPPPDRDSPTYWEDIYDMSNWIAGQPLDDESEDSNNLNPWGTFDTVWRPQTFDIGSGMTATEDGMGRYVLRDQDGKVIGTYAYVGDALPDGAPSGEYLGVGHDGGISFWQGPPTT